MASFLNGFGIGILIGGLGQLFRWLYGGGLALAAATLTWLFVFTASYDMQAAMLAAFAASLPIRVFQGEFA